MHDILVYVSFGLPSNCFRLNVSGSNSDLDKGHAVMIASYHMNGFKAGLLMQVDELTSGSRGMLSEDSGLTAEAKKVT